MSNIRYPLPKAVEEQLLSAPLVWATNRHQEADMPAKGMHQSAAVKQTQIAKYSLVKISATPKLVSRKQKP